ncbi:MAG: quinone-dependent dihydroorotate dehydrogenase [Candidatus Cyclobacteriaceae bacterium M2_1C_046]
MYKSLIRPLLFRFNAETAHKLTFKLLEILSKIPGVKLIISLKYKIKNPVLEQNLMGMTFPNPVGLAAGFDKDARLVPMWNAFGFGFVEIGTLTPVAQQGNPLPRIFRLQKDKALINRMGFNNEGVKKAVKRLKKQNSKAIVGGNIGKNKTTPNENAVLDYLKAFEELYPVVDYFVVNVSSPNTPGLRELQEKEPLMNLLNALQEKNEKQPKPKPVLLKIAPDLTDAQLNDITEIVKETEIAGIIATNTTTERTGLTYDDNYVKNIGAGGLSGSPLTKRATEVIKYLRDKLGRDAVIIGAGGIMTAEDALEKIEAGANLVQLYTGFIYEGPSLIKNINKKLIDTFYK